MRHSIAAALIVAAAAAPATAESPKYPTPPKATADLVDAPPTPAATLGPDRRTLLLMDMPNLPPIAEVAQPELRLAGLRMNPKNNAPSRRSYLSALSLIDVQNRAGRPRAIAGIPAGAKIGDVSWSP